MRKRLAITYPFSALLLGLFLTQILATIQVYLSNASLHDGLLAIKNAGYLTIPNGPVMDGLKDIGPALAGGLFFTFSIGAGITFFTLAPAWIWNRIFYRNKYIFYIYLLLWLVCLLALNITGFKLFLTLTILLVPPAVFVVASKSMGYSSRQGRRSNDMIHILPVLVLALLLGWQIDDRMFTDFRDIYLLSNPIGARINSFYYKYTLYPAEVFKSLSQKMLKTAAIKSDANDKGIVLESILLNYDYIPLKGDVNADLNIVVIEDDLNLENRGKAVMQISTQAFLADPDKVIRQFEKRSDTNSLLRQLTFISLLFGLPLAVYVIVHGMTIILAGFFFKSKGAFIIASMFCFVICIIMLFTFQFSRGRDVSAPNLPDALDSERWQARVSALKIIDGKGLEISQFKSYPAMLKSTHIAERYWLVKTLGNSRNPATHKDLLHFLNDPHPNVATMALHALGKRGNRDMTEEIMQIITTTDNWYIQWYAYKALRSIGWRQIKSN
jgi:Ca2+/Na+ antiporter